MQKVALMVLAVATLAVPSLAQAPGGNIYIGYSYARASLGGDHESLNGWNGSLEGKFLPFVGIVADLSGHYGNLGSSCPAIFPGTCPPGDERLYSVLFGPRVSFSVGRIRPFAHALFGVGHASVSFSGTASTDTSFASAYGGGVDLHLVPLLAWRVQLDDLHTRLYDGRQNNLRVSTGIVFNF
jgi:hypothetical protein